MNYIFIYFLLDTGNEVFSGEKNDEATVRYFWKPCVFFPSYFLII